MNLKSHSDTDCCRTKLSSGISTVRRSSTPTRRGNTNMAAINTVLTVPKVNPCLYCNKNFVQRCHLLRHIKKQHPEKVVEERLECQLCHQTFKRRDNLNYHERLCQFQKFGKRVSINQVGGGQPKRKRMDNVESDFNALDHTTDHFIKDLTQFVQTPETIIDVLKDNIKKLGSIIEVELERKRSLKIVVALHTTFHQATDPSFLSEPPPVFKTTPMEVLASTDIEEVLQIITEELLKKIDDFEERGSGWVLHELSRLDLHTYVYDPLRASTYIPVPDDLKAKHAVVNIQNKV